MRTFSSNNGPRDRRGQAHMAKESWKDVAAWSPRSWQIPQEGFCERCKKKVMVKVDDPKKQTCMECGSTKVRKLQNGENHL